MDYFLISVASFLVGGLVGWKVRERVAMILLSRLIKAATKEEDESSAPSHIMNVDLVAENDTFYIYESESNKFLVQVKNKDELVDFFQKKFPDRTVMMKDGDMQLMEAKNELL